MCTPCAGQRVQVGRQRRHQRLALAGAHLGDLAVVQHHAADQLHVEMAHAERALARFAHHREGFRQQLVERLAARDSSSRGCVARRLGVAGNPREPFLMRSRNSPVLARSASSDSFCDLRLERVDRAHRAAVLLEQPVVAAAEDLS